MLERCWRRRLEGVESGEPDEGHHHIRSIQNNRGSAPVELDDRRTRGLVRSFAIRTGASEDDDPSGRCKPTLTEPEELIWNRYDGAVRIP